MASNKPSQVVLNQEAHSQAISSAIRAVGIATSASSGMEELYSIFHAICKLSGNDEVVNGLAKVGFCLAGSHCDTFSIELENINEKLIELKGLM